MPNSGPEQGGDGWWIFKNYAPQASMECRSWTRRQHMLREQIQRANADIVCLQELVDCSFKADWDFMEKLGYANYALFRKGRFRPATFWRPSLELAGDIIHKDRVLVTPLRRVPGASADTSTSAAPSSIDCRPIIFVVNCHLKAMNDPDRRLRQVHEAVDACRKQLIKAKARAGNARKREKSQSEPAMEVVIVCGDFNCEFVVPTNAKSEGVAHVNEAVFDYLLGGQSATRSGKVKKNGVGLFQDVYADNPRPTLIAPPLIGLLTSPKQPNSQPNEDKFDNLTPKILDNLAQIFRQLATSRTAGGETVMSRKDVDAYITRVNLQTGRGSEYRCALSLLERRAQSQTEAGQAADPPHLTLSDFVHIYREEVTDGKYWGVRHDLFVLGQGVEEELTHMQPFQARYDYCFVSRHVRCNATLTFAHDKEGLQGFIPNEVQPSDHTPVGVELCL